MAQNVVQIIFIRGSQVLLGFCQNTEAYNKLWAFPAGRMELGESPEDSAKRESLEEVAVEPISLDFLIELPDPHVNFQHYVYICNDWEGEIKNAEPHLCREVCWFDIDNLPSNCIPTTYTVIAELNKYLLHQNTINTESLLQVDA